MKKFSKRISAVLLSVYMAFGVVSTDYLTVQAFEWVVPSLTVGDSILWLMGLLGVVYTEGASAWRDVSPEYEQDFIDYANEHGLTYTETSTWLNDTASGKLNQLSDVWTNFKEWVKSKFTSNSSGLSDNGVLSISNSIMSYYGLNSYSTFSGPTNMPTTFNYAFSYGAINTQTPILYLIVSDSPLVFTLPNSSSGMVKNENNSSMTVYSYNSSSSTSSNISFGRSFTTNELDFGYSSDNWLYLGLGFSSVPNIANFYNIAASSDSDNVYNPALIPDINFADSNTEDASIPGVIDLPWGNLGDDEEERDKTYDDLVGGLDLGKEIGDLWQALQDLMGVLAVDDAGVLQPNDGGENPPTLDDEAENNKVNGAFVLTGLQKVFPFCIPFDLYAFITLLESPPVAPVIQYPIYNPVTDSNEIITIDFSTWESVVVLFRYIFDFLFIIGLLLMARALIGGGDSA